MGCSFDGWLRQQLEGIVGWYLGLLRDLIVVWSILFDVKPNHGTDRLISGGVLPEL